MAGLLPPDGQGRKQAIATRAQSLKDRRKRRLKELLTRERELWAEGYQRVAGVDEAGVGPLAGPVVAAAVIFPRGLGLAGVDDSKKLTPGRREQLAVEIKQQALAFCIAAVEPPEIDAMNIYRASREAMRRALVGLSIAPDYLLIDGRDIRLLALPQETVVKGDSHCHAIAAASILAKTTRDGLMADYDEQFPGYEFSSHKGYPTKVHREAIRRLGPSPVHRLSFTLLPQPTLWD